MDRGTLGQADKTQLPAAAPAAIDAEYRKFEEVSSFVRARNARDYAISTAKGIDEGRYVTIGGIEQWVTIRGEDRSNPVLLFLHGGPRHQSLVLRVLRPLGKVLHVVQWDQKGGGQNAEKDRTSGGVDDDR